MRGLLRQTETVYTDGTRLFTYRNNTTRELTPEGHIIVRFHNGDIRKVRAWRCYSMFCVLWVVPLAHA